MQINILHPAIFSQLVSGLSLKRSGHSRYMLMMFILITSLAGRSQTSIYGQLEQSLSAYNISELPSPVCGVNGRGYVCSDGNYGPTCGTSDIHVLIPQKIAELESESPERFLKATAGVPYKVRFTVYGGVNM